MIAWVDLETTGLDTECSIIEVACVVTDEKLEEITRYQCLVKRDLLFETAEQSAIDMHVKSGLWELAQKNAKHNIYTVDRHLSEQLEYHAATNKSASYILGGQSVHFDRGFIERWMPKTNGWLSHRQIDVSGLKLFVSNAYDVDTDALPPFKSKTTHRAMDDILASIEAIKWYRDNLLYVPQLYDQLNSIRSAYGLDPVSP